MRHNRKRRKPPGSADELRIFHYTVAEHYNAIVRPATEGVAPGERPAVWFSIHPQWEPTATKALRDRKTGTVHRATWKEMRRYGPIRIEVGPEAASHSWEDYLRLSGASVATARGLEQAAKNWGANAFQWRVSFDPVPTEKWLAVEQWSGTGWKPIHRLPPNDPRVAFIAKTEEEWEHFRQAKIVVARDAKTGTQHVVFGREQIQKARDAGEAKIQALVVSFNPDTDELERLAAACLVLKGRHELT